MFCKDNWSFFLVALNSISITLDACLVTKVDVIARNAIKVTLHVKNEKVEWDHHNPPKCHIKLTFDGSCTSSGKSFVENKIPISNNSKIVHTLWLNDSHPYPQNITVCSGFVSQDSQPEFSKISKTLAKDDIPPIFENCYAQIYGEGAKLFQLDTEWTYVFRERSPISIMCVFVEDVSEKRVKWYKRNSICGEQYVWPGNTTTTFTIPQSSKEDEGVYYVVVENDFGKVVSQNITFMMAFQKRDRDHKKMSMEEGKLVQLVCNIQSGVPKIELADISWSRKINGIPRTLKMSENVIKSLDGSLLILEAAPENSGLYNCELSNIVLGETMLDNPTELVIVPKTKSNETLTYVPVKSISFGHKDTIVTLVDEMAFLQCIFHGRPRPQVSWYKINSDEKILESDRITFSNGNMTLEIFDVVAEDGGKYKCQASNSNESVEFKIEVIVHERPSLTVDLKSQNASRGDRVTFRCNYNGSPTPSSNWLINGSVVVENADIQIVKTSEDSKLIFNNVTIQSTCTVVCMASNKYGDVSSYAYLKVYERTKITSSARNLEEKDEGVVDARVYCRAETDPRTYLHVDWFVDGSELKPVKYLQNDKREGPCRFNPLYDELNITCHNLTSDVNVTCIASNDISSTTRSFLISLKHPLVASSQDGQPFFHGDMWWKLSIFVVGVGLIAMAVFLVIFGFQKFVQKGKKIKPTQSQMSVLGSQYRPSCSDVDSSSSHGGTHHLKKDLINVISSLLIPRNNLELKKCIGDGHFGRVYLATLMHGRQITEVVAVKTMKYRAEESEMVELFLKEAVLMKDFQHQHVLGIRGITFADDATPMVVLPYMANGDLRNYILNPELNITILNLLMMGLQVACGMVYLSKHHFVHRDLAARNCMVNENGVVKIADFGMSRQLISCDYYRVENGKDPVPIRWMAPECLEAKIFTTKSDVWAYGVLLWELMTRGAVPYPDAENWQVASLIQNGCLLQQPPFCPNVVHSMMTHCWIQDPSSRPAFEQLVEELTAVVNVVSPEVKRDSIIYQNMFKSE